MMHKREANLQGNNKFLFNLNNFDEPDDQAPEEDQAPSYTEEELEAAKEAAYNQGKQAGVQEEKESREQQVAQLLGQITQTFQTLITAEGYREQRYEEESLRLLYSALRNLFPALNKRLGTKEIEDMIERIVQTQQNKTKIIIKVPTALQGDIEELLSGKMNDEHQQTKYSVVGDDSLDEGSASMQWEDGGAIRDAQSLIENMILEVESLLPEEASHSAEPQKDDISENDVENEPNMETTDTAGDIE